MAGAQAQAACVRETLNRDDNTNGRPRDTAVP